eukprot:scaffold1305_cov374-Prasinococcus_capsulatus_cf.AAC.2
MMRQCPKAPFGSQVAQRRRTQEEAARPRGRSKTLSPAHLRRFLGRLLLGIGLHGGPGRGGALVILKCFLNLTRVHGLLFQKSLGQLVEFFLIVLQQRFGALVCVEQEAFYFQVNQTICFRILILHHNAIHVVS